MLSHILPIARYTLLEALRNRTFWLALLMVGTGLAITLFLQQVALTESAAIQASLLAALVRVGAVFMLANFVITSMVREFNDKVMELIIARPIRRSSYFFGKLAGFAAVAFALALLCGATLGLFAAPARAAVWALSLGCELLIMTGVALLCVFSLTQVTSALAAVSGFYVLSRSISSLQIMAANPLDDSLSFSQQAVNWMVEAIAFLLPGLDRMTQSGWLLYAGPSAAEIAHILTQTAVYMLLLCGAAMFDLQRKNF